MATFFGCLLAGPNVILPVALLIIQGILGSSSQCSPGGAPPSCDRQWTTMSDNVPHVYSLTKLTGRHRNDERRWVVFTVEAPPVTTSSSSGCR